MRPSDRVVQSVSARRAAVGGTLADPGVLAHSEGSTGRLPLPCQRETIVRTCGLIHIGLAVVDAERAYRFYERVFGVKEIYRDATSIQAETPRTHDVIALEEDPSRARAMADVTHFGFRLLDPKDLDAAARGPGRRAGGGRILERGEFVPGEPYLSSRTRTATASKSGTGKTEPAAPPPFH